MIELRAAETDDELELWRSVRLAILPNERTASVAELRAGGSFMLLAHRDGELVGSGSASKSDMGGGAVTPRVLPAHRRQGIGTAFIFQLIQVARDAGVRAVMAETKTNNLPIGRLLAKCAFQLAGVDTHRDSNHDLVKESATLLWYAALD